MRQRSRRLGRGGAVLLAIALGCVTVGAWVHARSAAAPGAQTYWQAISYVTKRPAFTPTRTITVRTPWRLARALAQLRAGDLVVAAPGITMPGEITIAKDPGGTAVVDLGSGAKAVHFTGNNDASDLPAVFVTANDVRIYGGNVTNPGGPGILMHGNSNVLWWGFNVHDTGDNGLGMFPVTPITGCDMQGETSRSGGNLAFDPHAEKGTGLHGANLADHVGTFANNRIALYVHDQPTGAAVEIGVPAPVPSFTGNVLYLKADRLTKVATQQVGGNGLNLWGAPGLGLDIKYIEVTNATGRAIDTGEAAPGLMSGVTVEYGVARHTNLNPYLRMTEASVPQTAPWDPRGGVVYRNVTPQIRTAG